MEPADTSSHNIKPNAKDAKKVYTEQSDPQKKAQYADEGKKKEEEE